MSLKIINFRHGATMLSLGGIALTTLGSNVISSNVQTVHADVADSQTNEISENAEKKQNTTSENNDNQKNTSTLNIKEESRSQQKNNDVLGSKLNESKVDAKSNTELPQAKNSKLDFYDAATAVSKMTKKIANGTIIHSHPIDGTDDEFSFKGSFSVNNNDVRKGTRIFVGKITATNNLHADSSKDNITNPTFSGAARSVAAHSDKYGTIGNMIFQKNPVIGNEMDLYLDVTTDKKFADDVNVTYAIPNAFQLGYQTNMAVYTGATQNKPFVETITGPSSSFKVERTVHNVNLLNSYQRENLMRDDAHTSMFGIDSEGLAWVSTADSKDALSQLIQSQGQNPIQLNNYHRVVQVSGQNLTVPNENGQYDVIVDIQVVDANGNLTEENIGLDGLSDLNNKISTQNLQNGLSVQQVYDQTPDNTVTVSKQNDGTYLVGFNLNPKTFTLTDSEIKNAVDKYSYVANIQDPAHKKQIIENTLAFEKNTLGNAPFSVAFYKVMQKTTPQDTDYVARDVTPVDNFDHSVANGTLGDPAALADGTIASHVTYVFVDDDNNEATVGLPTTLYGKTGTTVNPHLSIPAGYELATNQSLPGDYVLKDNNPLVQIHLKHKTGSAVVNTPASQTSEDISSTPATKTDNNSNKQTNQSSNDQQDRSQDKNKDKTDNVVTTQKQIDSQNKSLNDSALATKSNKSDSSTDSQEPDISKINAHPQKIIVKAASTNQFPTIQSQVKLPQTGSQKNNSATMIGVATLTGSFAAMFAMNRRKANKD